MGVEKQISALMHAWRLVLWEEPVPANLVRATDFLWEDIRFKICGNIDNGSLIMPTCSADVDWDIL